MSRVRNRFGSDLQMVRPVQAAVMLGTHKATLYKWAKAGKLPKPVRLSHRVSGWRLSDLKQWLDKLQREGRTRT